MRMPTIAAAAGALTLVVAGCYKKEGNYADNGYNAAGSAYEGNEANQYATTQGTTYRWPEGARIVVDNGVTYRVDPGGVRVRLGDADSRIEVVDGIRYRIDPGGTRVRIDDQGAVIVGPVPVTDNVAVTVNTQ